MKKSRLDDLLRRNKKHLALDLVITAGLLIGLSVTGLVAAVEVGKVHPTRLAASAPTLLVENHTAPAMDAPCEPHPLGPVAIQ